MLLDIGQLVYDKFETGQDVSDDLLKERVKEIIAIDQEIKILKADLESLKPESDASKSERADHLAGWKPTPGFCCPQCQAPANINKTFCVQCGDSLTEAGEKFKKGE